MIEYIVEFNAQLKLCALGDPRIFEELEVPVVESGSAQDVPSSVAEDSRRLARERTRREPEAARDCRGWCTSGSAGGRGLGVVTIPGVKVRHLTGQIGNVDRSIVRDVKHAAQIRTQVAVHDIEGEARLKRRDTCNGPPICNPAGHPCHLAEMADAR